MLDISLGFISFITSVIAGVLGFGGGMLLIALLPIFLNPMLVIPMHGISQLASNASRTLFSFRQVEWSLLPRFLLGSAIGMVIFGTLLANIPMDYLPVVIGSYLLLNLWSLRFADFIAKYESYYLIGALQTGLGLIVGATGPIALSVLTKQLTNKEAVIATSSIFMTISHLAKIVMFGLIGFSFSEHIVLILCMVVGSIAGSFVGTKLRALINHERWVRVIKVLLSLLAIYMIYKVFSS